MLFTHRVNKRNIFFIILWVLLFDLILFDPQVEALEKMSLAELQQWFKDHSPAGGKHRKLSVQVSKKNEIYYFDFDIDFVWLFLSVQDQKGMNCICKYNIVPSKVLSRDTFKAKIYVFLFKRRHK